VNSDKPVRKSSEAVFGGQDAGASSSAPATARDDPGSILSSWIAADPASQRLLEEVRRIAGSASTVLMQGESGTGKDLLASVLHFLSERAAEPFIKIDCATLPLELVESELFGYEKGAFTGATQVKMGRLEFAGAGTLVLDEVAALSLPLQAKLLRVIEERRFERLGGLRTLRLSARIVALTSVELKRAVSAGRFREDLYYRLNVIPVVIPALRERPGDIPPLAEHFLSQLARVHRKDRMRLAPGVIRALEKYGYPGNVRELRNLLERAVISATAPQIMLEDLPLHVREGAGGAKKMTLEELERSYIAEILDHTRGKKSRAAEILGISRKTLLEKRKRYGLE
jgi:transcriptional regulator with PAS, ATPase and Fis domain